MTEHNPSDSFDSHPESSGCSNDDFEQLDAPGNGYYHDNGDAHGPDTYGRGAYDDYEIDQDAEISTTNADIDEDELGKNPYAAGASDAEAYVHSSEPLISFEEEGDDAPEIHSVQPSAPIPEFEPSTDFARQIDADISPVVAPSMHSTSDLIDDFISSAKDDFGVHSEQGREQVEAIPEKAKTVNFVPEPSSSFSDERVSSTITDHSPMEKLKNEPETKLLEKEKAKESLLQNLDPRVKDLIYWRDVKKTGAIFGALLVVLLCLAIMSVISVVAHMSLVILTVSFSFVIYKRGMAAVQRSNDGHPFKALLEMDITLDEKKLKNIIDASLKYVNVATKELRRLFLVQDIVDSIKFGVILYALTYIGSWFSDMTLITIAIVLFFTMPKLYEAYQVQIDNYIGLANAQINKYLTIIQDKVPFLKKKPAAGQAKTSS